MILLRVKRCDRLAMIDDDMAHLLNFTWKLDRYGYVMRKAGVRIYLHHVVLPDGGAPGEVRDHEDRDKLNNQRGDMRWITRAQSNQNRGPAARNATGYRGVMQIGNRFRAAATLNKVQHHLGMFDTAEQARDVAQAWRDEHMTHAGDRARGAVSSRDGGGKG
jgi:hypothetical protein